MDDDKRYLVGLTADVAAQYFGKTAAPVEQIQSIIGAIFEAFKTAIADKQPEADPRPAPAVPIKKSVFPDHIVCLEDGKKFKMMKRYLSAMYDMTPDQYRERWGLPPDYPMVAPLYAQRRSELAKSIGLGLKPVDQPTPVAVVIEKPKRKKAA
jgi:predicted transcriptional regulator